MSTSDAPTPNQTKDKFLTLANYRNRAAARKVPPRAMARYPSVRAAARFETVALGPP